MNIKGICNYITITEKTFGREVSEERMHSIVLLFQIARTERSDYKLFIGDAFFIHGRPHIRQVSQAYHSQPASHDEMVVHCNELEILLLQKILYRIRSVCDKDLTQALYLWFGVKSKKFQIDKEAIQSALSQEPRCIREFFDTYARRKVIGDCVLYAPGVPVSTWKFPQLFYQTYNKNPKSVTSDNRFIC